MGANTISKRVKTDIQGKFGTVMNQFVFFSRHVSMLPTRCKPPTIIVLPDCTLSMTICNLVIHLFVLSYPIHR